MTTPEALLDPSSSFRVLFGPVALVLAALCLVLWLTGYGPGATSCKAGGMLDAPATEALQPRLGTAPPPTPSPSPSPSPSPTPPPPSAQAANSAVAATAVGTPGPVQLYFLVNNYEIDSDGRSQLEPLVAYLKANPALKVVLSGFHDPRSDRASNEAVAVKRARAARAALIATGINTDRIEMNKPVETAAGSVEQEARRVEVSIKP